MLHQNNFNIKTIISKATLDKIKKIGIKYITINSCINYSNCKNEKKGFLDKIKFITKTEESKSDKELNMMSTIRLRCNKNIDQNIELEISKDILEFEEDYKIVLNNNSEIKQKEFYYNSKITLKQRDINKKIEEAFQRIEEYYNNNIKEIIDVCEYH